MPNVPMYGQMGKSQNQGTSETSAEMEEMSDVESDEWTYEECREILLAMTELYDGHDMDLTKEKFWSDVVSQSVSALNNTFVFSIYTCQF